MDFGYKSFIATVLVCAAWCKGRSANVSEDKNKADSSIVINNEHNTNVADSARTYHMQPEKSRNKQTEEILSNFSKDSQEMAWARSETGSKIINAWLNVMREQSIYYKLTIEDLYALIELGTKDRTINSTRAVISDYPFSAEDLITLTPDEKAKDVSSATKEYDVGRTGACFHNTKGIVMSAEPIVYMEGSRAYEATGWLDKNPNVVKIQLDYENLDKMPEGALVVFKKGQTPSGHIYVSVKENDTATYTSQDNVTHTYEIAGESSDHRQSANLRGIRGRTGQRYGQAYAYLLNGTELSINKFFSVVSDVAKNEAGKIVITPRDACEAADGIRQMSVEQHQKLVAEAKLNFPTFKNAEFTSDNQYLIPEKKQISKYYKTTKRRGRTYAQNKRPTTRGSVRGR